MNEKTIRSIAAYLPQFHPIPENDKWWGKGFTEWTNVAKAKPLFKGHWQPRLPADLGFYDLRVAETRQAQADLAKQFGIYGFMYWHYWFGGKQLLEMPLNQVVESRKPDFPFCIAWANQTWQGTWHGLSNKEVLMKQTYPGVADDTAHFYALLKTFSDQRYIEINGKKLVFIFNPGTLPNLKRFIDTWRQLAAKEGFNGLHFVGLHMPIYWAFESFGFDAMIPEHFVPQKYPTIETNLKKRVFNRFVASSPEQMPRRLSYQQYVESFPEHKFNEHQYPWIMPDWDNTPRAHADGWLFEGSTPELFGELCLKAFYETENKADQEKVVFIKSWNEWAEGNYLEPDNRYGTSYLEHFAKALQKYESRLTTV